MTTLAGDPKGRDGGDGGSMSSKICHLHGACPLNGNTFADRELQAEIFFLIIGHP